MYQVFNLHSDRYEQWFEKNSAAYESEIKAVKAFIPENGRGIEVGIGSGRFSVPFSIQDGVDPSVSMRNIAIERGLHAIDGIGEELPYKECEFNFVLIITTLCFVDNPITCCKEAWRILKIDGSLIIGIVDKTSFLGKQYERIKDKNVFYRDAHFYSTDEVVDMMRQAGFDNIEFRQTIFQNPTQFNSVEIIKKGHGEGAFVVIKGTKK
jgi:ubiquinone/menaquinone biosynthesis C-methylase UbiE